LIEPVTSGALRHSGPGRTDDLNVSVPSESFVVPADAVSAIGQGNTENGFRALEKMFPPSAHPGAGKVPIVAAGGEFVVHPFHVKRVGGGDMKSGHKALADFVAIVRDKAIKKLKKLPKPVNK
jgi:hypothetical protein